MLGKNQIRVIFLHELKLGRRATETARNINNVFGLGTTNKRTVLL